MKTTIPKEEDLDLVPVDDPDEIASIDRILNGILLILTKRAGGEIYISRSEWTKLSGDTLMSMIDADGVQLVVKSRSSKNVN